VKLKSKFQKQKPVLLIWFI